MAAMTATDGRAATVRFSAAVPAESAIVAATVKAGHREDEA
jgi:hypothetical protein